MGLNLGLARADVLSLGRGEDISEPRDHEHAVPLYSGSKSTAVTLSAPHLCSRLPSILDPKPHQAWPCSHHWGCYDFTQPCLLSPGAVKGQRGVSAFLEMAVMFLWLL